jgi:transporter family-2 protein
MGWSLLLPFYIGFATVFQAGLNRFISRDWGLGSVVMFSSMISALAALLFWLAVHWAPSSMPEIFRDRGGMFSGFSWWYWIPGVLGFSIVVGIPFAIARIGALQTFVILIGSQIVFSMVWDAMYEGKPVNTVRVIGAAMAFAAAALVNLKG